MRGFLVIQQQKRFGFVSFIFEPIQTQFSGDSGYITLYAFFYTIDDKIRIVVVTLTGQYSRIVKPLWQSPKVNFSNHSGLVASGLEVFGEVGLIPVEVLDVVNLSIYKAMLSSEHYRPTGCTNGVSHKAFIEKSTLKGNSVNIGGVIQTMPISTHRLKSVIIRHDKYNVGWL